MWLAIKNPFQVFERLCTDVLRKAGSKGGENYRMKTFNVQYGARTPSQNQTLKKFVDKITEDLKDQNKITECEHRNETAFLLDTKTGKYTF